MTPRDANYLGEENHTCLLRQELIEIYQRDKSIELAKTKLKELEKELAAEREAKAPKLNEGQDMSEEQKTEMSKLVQAQADRRSKSFYAFL